MIRNTVNNNDVLYKLLEAKSFQTIADELGVSKTSISNAVKKLEKEIGEKNIKTLLEIASAVKKSGTSFAQILSCARVYKILEKQNLDDEHVHDLLTEIIPKINNKTELSELFDATKKVLDLQESTGMALDEIENYCDAKKQEIESLDEKLKNSKEETEQSVSAMNNTFTENNITKENLDEYVNARGYLKENGAQIEELPTVANMIKNASKEKYNSKTIIAQISENQSLEQKNTDLVEQDKHLLKQIQVETKENQRLDHTLERKHPIIEQVERFEKIGVTPDYLLMLFQEIIAIGVKTGIGAPKIIEKITRDIKEQYEQKIGFENALKNLKKEINSEQQDLKKIREEKIRVFVKVKILRKEIARLEATIEEYNDVIIKTFRNTMSKQQNDLAGFVQHQQELANSLFKTTEYKITKMLENLKDENIRNKQSVDEVISEISKIFEMFGHYKFLRALANTARAQGTPGEVYSSMITIITGFQEWREKHNITDIFLSNNLVSLKKGIEKELSKNVQAA